MREKIQNHLTTLRRREAVLKKELTRVKAQIDVLEHLTASTEKDTTFSDEPVAYQSPLPVEGLAPVQSPAPQTPAPQTLTPKGTSATQPEATAVRERLKWVLRGMSTPAKSLDRLDLQDRVMSLEKGECSPIPEEYRTDVEQMIAAILACGAPFREVKTGKKAGNVYYRK